MKKIFSEDELPSLAKHFREKARKRKVDAARELEVSSGNINLAEEYPEQSLTSLRIRIIEKYSKFKVEGPLYRLKRK